MSKESIKVVVAGRTYPLTVTQAEKDRVLQAAEEINRSIKLLQENYAVKDTQDLLAMTALQLATKSGNTTTASQPSQPDYSTIEKALENLAQSFDLNL